MVIKLSDLYTYKNLSAFGGLMGKTPVVHGGVYVGVEIELEHCLLKTVPRSFSVENDGSLKEKGKEFITIPIKVKYLEIELIKLFEGLMEYKSTQRCSTHVHINVRDLTLQQLELFITLYIIFEKSLYRYSGNRYTSNFCVPLSHALDYAVDFISCLKRGYIKEDWKKYFAFNLSPIFGGESGKLGTIEFRHLKGTDDVPYIVNWINLITSLKIAAKKINYDIFVQELKPMNTTSSYNKLAMEVFKDYSGLLTEQIEFKDDVEEGVTLAKQVLLSCTLCEIEIGEMK